MSTPATADTRFTGSDGTRRTGFAHRLDEMYVFEYSDYRIGLEHFSGPMFSVASPRRQGDLSTHRTVRHVTIPEGYPGALTPMCSCVGSRGADHETGEDQQELADATGMTQGGARIP